MVHISVEEPYPGDAAALTDLGTFLRQRVGAVVDETGAAGLEVSLLGSYSDTAMRRQLGNAVRSWSLLRQRHDLKLEIR